MTNFWLMLIPLSAAFIYVAAVLSLKRASDLKAGLWHSTLLANLFSALAFQVLLVFGGDWPPFSQWWQPSVVAILFLSGQIWTLFSLQKGDVSVATPVLGLKIIFVGFFTTLLLAEALSWQLWLGAGLATGGVALLSHSGARKTGISVNGTLISAFAAAISFALFDVLVQKWSPLWGIGRFLPVSIGFVGIISLAAIPFFPSSPTTLPAATMRWLTLGSILFAFQSLVFVSGIAYFGGATTSNVIYSSRGLWSIIAVSLLGHWFHSNEQSDTQILHRRFFGAICMFAAVVLVLV